MLTLRFAARLLLKTPFLSTVAILSLAFGIGANAAMFSLFNQILLRKLPVRDPNALVNVSSPGPRFGNTTCGDAGSCDSVFSYPLFRDLEQSQQVFTALAAHRSFDANVSIRDQTFNSDGLFVSGSYFPVLELQPSLGRLIGPDDDRSEGGAPVAVLSHSFWDARFDRAPVLGETLIVNGQALTIIGVAPPGFDGTTFGSRPQFFVPITMRTALQAGIRSAATGLQNRRNHWLYLFARLKPGVAPEQARASLSGTFKPILNDVEAPLQTGVSPDMLARFRARDILLADGSRGQSNVPQEARAPVTMMLGVTAFVLLIACANITNLLLARTVARAPEMAIRLSIGASRRQLVSQLLVESLLLAVISGAAALVVAHWTIRFIGSLMPADDVGLLRPEIDGAMLAFTAVVALTTGVIVGLAPALGATRSNLVTTLKNQAGQPSGGRATARLRTSLAVAQMALSMALLVAAGLFIKSLFNVNRVDLGFSVDRIIAFAIAPGLNGYSPERSRELFTRLEEELQRVPGVSSVTSARVPLLGGSNSGTNVTVEGFTSDSDADSMSSFNVVGAEFFKTTGIPIVAGRDLSVGDALGSPRVVIVNEAFARKFQMGANPVGRRMGVGRTRSLDIEIVGLARDAKYSDAKAVIPPLFFAPYRQDTDTRALTFYVKAEQESAAVASAIPRVVRDLDPTLPVQGLRTLSEQVRENIFLDRLMTILSSAFAILATLLASIGLYGVLAYTIAQRTKEIGVRMVLGATPGRVRNLVVRQMVGITAIGCLIGLSGAWALGSLAESMLFGMSGRDPVVIIASAAALIGTAVIASILPARRAAGVDPIRALRYE